MSRSIDSETRAEVGAAGTAATRPARSFFARVPAAVWICALLAAALHMMPAWRAAASVQPGWTFTGNTRNSPDYMQYRVWARQTQIEGPIVSNVFTAEPNQPHLPVFFYYVVGKTAEWLGQPPEFVVNYYGAVFAAALTLLLFMIARYFMRSSHATWWVFGAMWLGGGLGGHLKWLARTEAVYNNGPLSFLLVKPLEAWPYLFEDYRSHYIINTLFDTHFLLIWISALAAMLGFYAALKKPTLTRVAVTALLFAVATWVHIYEGVTLLVAAGGVVLLCAVKGMQKRESLVILVASTAAVGISGVIMAALYRGSGLPAPTWRAINILLSILLISYPLAFAIIAWGLPRYWKNAGLDEVFLMGWALGCLVLTLSGPFFPYPDRGTMTLLVPLYLMAGAIYFARFPRVHWRAAVVAIFVLAATPAFVITLRWKAARFRPEASFMYLKAEQAPFIELLRGTATRSDVLLAEPRELLWLAPDYPGRHYAGHFFLTVDYDQKIEAVAAFRAAAPEDKAEFLRASGIRFLYVSAKDDQSNYLDVPGLQARLANGAGTLFEFVATPAPLAN